MAEREKQLYVWINGLQQKGRYTFTIPQIHQSLSISKATIEKGLYRLSKSGRIRQIRRGFYTIIPLEYLSTGELPPEYYIDDLMQFLNRSYYVGLLSAAALHGAAHQKPQVFQIITDRFLSSIKPLNLMIEPVLFRDMDIAITMKMKSMTGYFKVSSPEWTAIDLFRFPHRAGGYSNIMTVLVELSESLSPKRLLDACKREKDRSHCQRLGWMLDKIDQERLTVALADWIGKIQPSKVRLNPTLPYKSNSLDRKWKVVVNDEPESDI